MVQSYRGYPVELGYSATPTPQRERGFRSTKQPRLERRRDTCACKACLEENFWVIITARGLQH